MITLNDYIEQLITFLHLSDTEKNKKKIKKKFERTLKEDLKIWDIAETIKVAKTKAKIFKFSDLEKAYQLNQKYLSKLLDIDEQQYQEKLEYNNWLKEQNTVVSKEEFDRVYNLISDQNTRYEERYKVSIEEQNNVMLKALFERFYTPLDIKQWEKDRVIVDTFEDKDDLTVISAQLRLEQPDGKAYYNEK